MRKEGFTWVDSKVCYECMEGGLGGPILQGGWDHIAGFYAKEGEVVAERGLQAGRVSGRRRNVLGGTASAACKGRAAERVRGLRIGPWTRGREGGLGAEWGLASGLRDCLVQGESSRGGKGVANWARMVEAGRVASGPRGGQLVGAVSAWCEVRIAKRARAVFVGTGWWRLGGWSPGRERASWREL